MTDILLITIFFICLINLVLVIGMFSQLLDLQADLYYYSELKNGGDDD